MGTVSGSSSVSNAKPRSSQSCRIAVDSSIQHMDLHTQHSWKPLVIRDKRQHPTPLCGQYYSAVQCFQIPNPQPPIDHSMIDSSSLTPWPETFVEVECQKISMASLRQQACIQDPSIHRDMLQERMRHGIPQGERQNEACISGSTGVAWTIDC